MKFLCIAVLLFAGLVSTARAQSEADDKYIAIYGIIQQADNLATMGDPGEALAAFGDAQRQLQAFQKEFPDWNPNIVSFRLGSTSPTGWPNSKAARPWSRPPKRPCRP